jgi:anti-sigma B factor antagonist
VTARRYGPHMAFTLDHDPVAAGRLLVAEGELDLTAVSELSTVFAMAGASPERSVVLDLAAVDFIDSSSLSVIMRAAGELERDGKRLLVVAPDGPVRRLLEITNLTQRFELHPTRDEALAAAGI